MDGYRFLIVEDQPHWQGALADLLRKIVGSHVEECSRRDAAIKLATAQHFDVYFVDLVLDLAVSTDEEDYEGVRLIEDLRGLSLSSVIVAYSATLGEGHEDSKPVTKSCYDAGADCVLARKTLLSMASSKLSERINGWINHRNTVSSIETKVLFASDIATKAGIEIVGAGNLSLIVADLLPNMAQSKIHAMAGGYSGATLVQISFSESKILARV